MVTWLQSTQQMVKKQMVKQLQKTEKFGKQSAGYCENRRNHNKKLKFKYTELILH